MKTIKVKLGKVVKEVQAANLNDLRLRIGQAHRLIPELIKFIKPAIKDDNAFQLLAVGVEILVMGTVMTEKAPVPEEDPYYKSLQPAEKKRYDNMRKGLEFMGWDAAEYPQLAELYAWLFASYGMPQLYRWLKRRGQQGGGRQQWMVEYNEQRLKQTDKNEADSPNYFGFEITWYHFRSFSDIALLKRTHPVEMIMEWNNIFNFKYKHPRRNLARVENLFGFHHNRKITDITTEYSTAPPPKAPAQFPDNILPCQESHITVDVTDEHQKIAEMITHKSSKVSLFRVREEDTYFDPGDVLLKFKSTFMALAGRLPGYLIVRLCRWSGSEENRTRMCKFVHIPRFLDIRSLCSHETLASCKNGTDKLDRLVKDKYRDAIFERRDQIIRREMMTEGEIALTALDQVLPKYMFDDMHYNLNDADWPDAGTTSYRICSIITQRGKEAPDDSLYGAAFRHKEDVWYHVAGLEVTKFGSMDACLDQFSGLNETQRESDTTMYAEVLIYRRMYVDLI